MAKGERDTWVKGEIHWLRVEGKYLEEQPHLSLGCTTKPLHYPARTNEGIETLKATVADVFATTDFVQVTCPQCRKAYQVG